jgi:glutathione S-transferase
MYRLISATPSPYARKVRIQLAEKGIPFELLTEVPWNGDTATPRHNPLEKLPVLLLPDGGSVYESRFINEWIEARHPSPPLVPDDIDGRLAVKRFEVLADGACDALVLMFWENARGPERRSEPWLARQQRKVDGAMQELARLVGDSTWCHGDRFSQADIAVGALLGYLRVRWPAYAWMETLPNLARLSDRLEARPSFASTRPVPQTVKDAVV